MDIHNIDKKELARLCRKRYEKDDRWLENFLVEKGITDNMESNKIIIKLVHELSYQSGMIRGILYGVFLAVIVNSLISLIFS